MALDGRVTKLEQAFGVGNDEGGECKCPTMNRDIRKYTEETSVSDAAADIRPPEVCLRCGQPKQIIQIIVCRTRADVEASR